MTTRSRTSRRAWETASLSLSLAVVAGVAVAGFLVVAGDPFAVRLLTLAGVYAALAIGLRLQLGEMGELNLGHTVLFATGAYGFAILGTRWDIGGLLALVLAMLAAAVLALAVALVTLRLSGPYFAVATLGLVVVGTAVLLNGGDWTGEVYGLGRFGGGRQAEVPVVGAGGETALLLFAWGVALVVVLTDHWLRLSRFGRAMNAIRQDPLLFSSLGFDVARFRILVTVIAGAMAGLAGGAFALYEGFTSVALVGLPLLATTIVTVVAGGTRAPGGVLLASVIFTLGPEYARWLEDYRLVAFGAVLLVLLRVAPHGVGPLVIDRIAPLFERGRVEPPPAVPGARAEPATPVAEYPAGNGDAAPAVVREGEP